MPFSLLDEADAKKVVLCRDDSCGLRAVIAIHSTTLGPAAGGLRMKEYASDADAVRDALRLARAMTYKYAASDIAMGGAKAVIIGDPRKLKTQALLRSFARFVEEQNGEFSAGEDVGTDGRDMQELARETQWLVSLPEESGGPGDVSHTTARGVRQAIRACAQHAFGSPSLDGKRVAVQGLGQVGAKLARLLADDGAELLLADLDAGRASRVARDVAGRVVDAKDIISSRVDILAPCALGDAIHAGNVGSVQASIVAGAANNVFSTDAVADILQRRGAIYAVDYIANAGGIVYDDIMRQRPRPQHFDHDAALERVDRIYDRTLNTLTRADAERCQIREAALAIAEERLRRG